MIFTLQEIRGRVCEFDYLDGFRCDVNTTTVSTRALHRGISSGLFVWFDPKAIFQHPLYATVGPTLPKLLTRTP